LDQRTSYQEERAPVPDEDGKTAGAVTAVVAVFFLAAMALAFLMLPPP
jgi:hypothetical protein